MYICCVCAAVYSDLSEIGTWNVLESRISAEVIGLVTHSIGEQLYYSKLYLMTADLFAWSIAVVFMSFIFEKIFMKLVDLTVLKMRKL